MASKKAKQDAASTAIPVTRYCGRCGCPYEGQGDEWKCPECGCPEYSLQPDVLHEGWLRRQKAAKKRTLYDLTDDLVIVLSIIDDADGEIDEELEKVLDELSGDIDKRADGIVRLIRECEMLRDGLAAERDRIAKRAASQDKAVERLKSYLKTCLTKIGMSSLKTPSMGTLSICKNSKISIEFLGAAWEAPEEFQRTKIEIDKEAVAKHFAETGDIPQGFAIEQGYHLRIT